MTRLAKGATVTHRAFGQSPLSLGLQIAGLALVVWARVAFGARSFHAGSTPTEGGLVTSGPYHFIRHPIYAGVLLALMFMGISFLSDQIAVQISPLLVGHAAVARPAMKSVSSAPAAVDSSLIAHLRRSRWRTAGPRAAFPW